MLFFKFKTILLIAVISLKALFFFWKRQNRISNVSIIFYVF